MKILRTPDCQFENLPDYDYPPHYTTIADDDGTEIRIHHIEVGPKDAEPLLLMHGNPTWSYIYRKMIPGLVKTGKRIIAVDLVGCGRSDKPSRKSDYTLARHQQWMRKWLLANDLNNISLFAQDWGGTIGLYLVSQYPDRFDRLIFSNSGMPAGEGGNRWLRIWLFMMKVLPSFPWRYAFKRAILAPTFNQQEFAAYRAPFPSLAFQAGILSFPQLIAIFPDNPGVELNRQAWKRLEQFYKPVLTLFGNMDPVTRGGQKIIQRRIPGAKGQPHRLIDGAGHFCQEDKPEALVEGICEFLAATA